MPRSVLDASGKLDPKAVRERAIEEAVDIDVKKDRRGRAWVKDFPVFVRMPEGVSPVSPDGVVETRYIMRYVNGKAEYVLDADDNGVAIGRLINGVMYTERPEEDEDGNIITEEDKAEERANAKSEAARAMQELEQSGLSVSSKDDRV